jgi:predicted RND superfamily exporter protein
MFNANDKLAQFLAKHPNVALIVLFALIVLSSYE